MPGGRRFMWSGKFDTRSRCVLATDGQLQDIVRACPNSGVSCVFGIDPTFKFYVTVTTFMYYHVENKSTSKYWTNFVHTDDSYYSLLNLLKVEPCIRNIIALCTDGEQALVKVSFLNKLWFVHIKHNIIRRKVTDMLLMNLLEEFVRDILTFSKEQSMWRGFLMLPMRRLWLRLLRLKDNL